MQQCWLARLDREAWDLKDRDTSTCRWSVLTSDADMGAGGELDR